MSELFADVIDDYRIHKRASIDDARSRVRLHLEPAFGKTRAAELGTQDLQRYIGSRRAAGAEDSTINRELALVRRAFRLAATSDPPKVVRLLKVPRLVEDNVRTGFLEYEQYVPLRDALPARLKAIFVVGYHLGCRFGELRQIEWSQVDLEAGEIRLFRHQTKSKKPRTVPIYGEMKEWLQLLREEREARQSACRWVFQFRGRRIGQHKKGWDEACAQVGLAGLLFHDLRRSAVRNMERAGIPRKVAMEISGHRTEAVYRRYDIVSPRDLKLAGQKLEHYLAGEKAPVSDGLASQAESGKRRVN
jgi:integrase